MKRLFIIFVLIASANAQVIFQTVAGSAQAQVATPSYDHDTGSYVSSVTVTISDATSGAAGKYCTAVGSDCDPSGGTTIVNFPVSPAAISVTNTHLCSYATKGGMTQSATKCATYTITGNTVTIDSANVAKMGTAQCSGAGTSTFTCAVTAGSQTDTYALFGCTSIVTATGATFNGTPLTAVGNASSGTILLYVYGMKVPPSGTHNFVITYSGTAYPACGFVPLYNVNQTTPTGTVVLTNEALAAVASGSVTSSSGDLVVDFVAWTRYPTNTITVDASQTSFYTSPNYASDTLNGQALSASYKAGPTGGGNTMQWTLSTTLNWAQVSVPVKHD